MSKQGPAKKFRLGKGDQELEAVLEELRLSEPANTAVPPKASAKAIPGVPATDSLGRQTIDLIEEVTTLRAREAELMEQVGSLTEQMEDLTRQRDGLIRLGEGYEALLGSLRQQIDDAIP